MSADLLREAAKVMRERADAVARPCPSPWEAHPSTKGMPSDGPTEMRVSDRQRLEVVTLDYSAFGGLASEHIASWHPAVALAVADWLDEVAETTQFFKDNASTHPAIKVARAYLGRDA